MKFTLNVRHRPTMAETAESQLARLVAGLRDIRSPWGLSSETDLRLPPFGTALDVDVRLTGKLGRGLTGYATFGYRAPDNLRDSASHDDFVVVSFNSKQILWSDFASFVVPAYVKATNAYMAHVYRWDEAPDEWGRLKRACDRSGMDLNGRDGFFKFGPIAFMDRELCMRSCRGMQPEEIVKNLIGTVPDVRLCQDGVMIVAATDYPSQEEIDAMDRAIRKRLGLTIWAEEATAR